jgi:hypothetical protein
MRIRSLVTAAMTVVVLALGSGVAQAIGQLKPHWKPYW